MVGNQNMEVGLLYPKVLRGFLNLLFLELGYRVVNL